MATLSSANTKYTAEQLTKATGISAETLATWGLTEATDTLTMSQLAEIASSDAQAKKVLEKIVAQNAQAVASGKVVASNASLVASETSATLATGSFTTAIKANIAAMWTWMTTTPLGWLTLLAAGIFAAVKAYDALTVSAEEASDKIEESRSAYEETTSTIESMNSELETTKKRIEELEAKDALSFTDKAELDNLREQNAELERSISLLDKKRQNEAKQTVVDIKQNQETLDEDFDKSIKNLSEYKKEYEETRQLGIKGMAQGAVTLENYEATMAAMDKTMGQYESSVLDNIEKYEQYKEDIINKYGTNDISTFSQSDRALYNDIVSQLQAAYKEIYTNSEYNKFVIEPIFNQEDLKGLQDELIKYFINGGYTDLSSLEEKFGSDIITALRNACERAGIDFDKMIGDIYNNSQSKLNQIAPIVTAPTGAYDAKQNSISKQIRDYIQNDLSEEDRTILLNAEIPDDVKFRTKQDVDNYIASLKADVDTNETDIFSGFSEEQTKSIDDFQSKVKTLSDMLSSLQSGSLDEGALTDLIQEFPELQGQSENLEQAIIELIYNALQELYDTFGEGLPDDLKNDLQSIADVATNVTPSLDEAFSSIQKSYETLSDFKEAMSTDSIDSSILNTISGLSSELNTLVAGFYAGAVSADELYSALQDHYKIDQENYSKALIAKNGDNEQFYNSIGMTSADVVNKFNEDYGIDIENCKTYNELKKKIELETLGTISDAWSKYYDAQTQSLTGLGEYMLQQANTIPDNPMKNIFDSKEQTIFDVMEHRKSFFEQTGFGDVLDAIEKYEAALDGLNDITYEGIGAKFESISRTAQKASENSSKSASSTSDKWKEAFQAEYDTLKHNLEMERITESEYYNSLDALNKKYFAGKSEYLDEYRQYEKEVYKGLKSINKEAYEAYKNYLDSYMDYQKKSLENGKISYKTYCKTISKSLKSAYKDGKIAAKDYYDYTKQILESKKEIYDGVISAVTNLLDKEIDKINDSIDAIEKKNDALEEEKTLMENAASAVVDYYQSLIDNIEDANDALEKQNNSLEEQLSDMNDAISAVVNYYDSLIDGENDAIDALNKTNDSIQERIDKYDSLISVSDKLYEDEQNRLKDEQESIQEKIDLLQEENDQKDLQYRKEQALYELQRSQEQRTKKVYAGGDKGFIYETDKSAISDAQKNLQDIQTEELVNSLEKEKEALHDSIDALQKYRDALSDISEAHKRLVDERNTIELVGSDYESIILGTSIEDWNKLKDAYIKANDEISNNENLIKSHEEKITILEEEKEQWSSLIQSITDETNKQKAIEKFGSDWEKKINDGRFNDYKSFKNSYIKTQSQINNNTETINSNKEKIKQYNILKEQWNSLTSTLSSNTNKQAAIQKFGADWEKQINDGRLQSFGSFQSSYLDIQSKINDNTETINSYKEKIEYYESLKKQWQSVTSAYDEETNKQYAKMILGAEWETEVLSGRLKTLDSFKKNYVDIQQKIAEAAWNSANEQIKAAKEAEKAAKGTTGSANNIGTVSNVSSSNVGENSNILSTWTVVDKLSRVTLKAGFSTQSLAVEWAFRNGYYTSGVNSMQRILYVIKKSTSSSSSKSKKAVKGFASGTDNAEPGWHKVSEKEKGDEIILPNDGSAVLAKGEQLYPFEGGETVINASETKRILGNMDNLIPLQEYSNMFSKMNIQPIDYSSMVMNNMRLPDFSKLAVNRYESTPISIGDIHLHEVQNVPDFAKALQKHLPNISVQYNGRH